MVLLRESGMTQPAIAEAMGVSLSTVNRAHMAYDGGGIKALKPKPIGGRQRENMTLCEEKALHGTSLLRSIAMADSHRALDVTLFQSQPEELTRRRALPLLGLRLVAQSTAKEVEPCTPSRMRARSCTVQGECLDVRSSATVRSDNVPERLRWKRASPLTCAGKYKPEARAWRGSFCLNP